MVHLSYVCSRSFCMSLDELLDEEENAYTSEDAFAYIDREASILDTLETTSYNNWRNNLLEQ